MTPQTPAPRYRVVNSLTGRPVGDPHDTRSEASAIANVLNAMWLRDFGGVESIFVYMPESVEPRGHHR